MFYTVSSVYQGLSRCGNFGVHARVVGDCEEVVCREVYIELAVAALQVIPLLNERSEVVIDCEVLHTQVRSVLEIVVRRGREVAVRVKTRQTGNIAAGVRRAPGIKNLGRAVEVTVSVVEE